MVHVGMRDEDVAHPQKLAGRQTRDVADVKQDRPPLELQVDEHPRAAERPVDQRRAENGPHLAENTIRGPSESARQPRPRRGARVEALLSPDGWRISRTWQLSLSLLLHPYGHLPCLCTLFEHH